MAKKPARFDRAVEKLQDTIEAIGMLHSQHNKILQTYQQLLTQRDEAEKEMKDAAKEVADKDTDFRDYDGSGFFFNIVPVRTVDMKTLEKVLGKKPEEVEGLTEVKVSVKIDSITALAKAKVIPANAVDAIKISSYSVKLGYGEREENKKAA